MADHGHHDPGGHELEAINTKLLFRLMISLSLVTLLAAIAVVQWFYSQRRELENQLAAEGSFQLIDYKTKMSADLEGVDRVAQNMVANPALLQAPPAPPGWIHPDDLVGGGAAAPAVEPKHEDKPVEVPVGEPVDAPIPVEGEPADGEAPADDAEKPADDADKPAEKNDGEKADKPAEKADKPAEKADKPAEKADKPAEKADKADDND